MSNLKRALEKFKALSRTKQILLIVVTLAIFGAMFGDKKSSSSKHSTRSRTNESSTPSFTCKNCGGHSFHYHETVTAMQVCNSCGIGQ
jgi:ribosomal protein L37E